MDNRGQALLESLVISGFFIFATITLTWSSYRYFSHLVIEQWVYEASLCLHQEKTDCRSIFQSKLKSLPFYRLRSFRVSDALLKQKVFVQLSVYGKTEPLNFTYRLSKNLSARQFRRHTRRRKWLY